jgi:hypothetical protein
MDVNEDKRPPNTTHRHKLKQKNGNECILFFS